MGSLFQGFSFVLGLVGSFLGLYVAVDGIDSKTGLINSCIFLYSCPLYIQVPSVSAKDRVDCMYIYMVK